jgi:hypothetical protein
MVCIDCSDACIHQFNSHEYYGLWLNHIMRCA